MIILNSLVNGCIAHCHIFRPSQREVKPRFNLTIHLTMNAIKLFILVFSYSVLSSNFTYAQSDEELREQIRKEILEEQKLEEEKELLEYRKAKIRREEEARIEAEKAVLKERLLKKEEPIDSKPKKEESNTKETYLQKRLNGWAISVHIGPNFGLGDYAKTSGNGWYAGVGLAAQINNYVHFGKVGGIFIGLGYDSNRLNERAYLEGVKSAVGQGVSVSLSSIPHQHYSILFGGSIRAMGKGAAFYFRPHVGLNLSNVSDYSVVLRDGTQTATVNYKGKTTTRFAFGANFELAVQVTKSSDIIIGIGTNMSFGSVAWEISATGEQTQFGSSDFDPVRLTSVFGYRFHL